MPGSRRRALTLAAVSPPSRPQPCSWRSRASPRPRPLRRRDQRQPCDLIVGPAKDYCEDGEQPAAAAAPPPSPTDALDPLTSLAKGCADAAAWTVDKLSPRPSRAPRPSTSPTPPSCSQYAVVFAASTILTLVLWLLAVAKRAVRGVPLTTRIDRGRSASSG